MTVLIIKNPFFSGIICGSLKKECLAARERKKMFTMHGFKD